MLPKRALVDEAQPQRGTLARLVEVVTLPLDPQVPGLEGQPQEQVAGFRGRRRALESAGEQDVADLDGPVGIVDVHQADDADW